MWWVERMSGLLCVCVSERVSSVVGGEDVGAVVCV